MGTTTYSSGWRESTANAVTQRPAATTTSKKKDDVAAVHITQQFRERHNMTYEINCSGVPLVLRIFFPRDGAGAEWRIEARAGHVNDVSVASASAATRAQALQMLAQRWRDTAGIAPSSVDWSAVTQALASVRAI